MDPILQAIQQAFQLSNVSSQITIKTAGLPFCMFTPAVPSPTSVSISSDMDNPIPYGSSPTLTCMVSLSPAIDVEVEIIVEWSGQTYGLRKYTTTPPVLNSSAEVPIYTSSARLDATGTFYDSGQYYCSVVLNSLTNRDVIRSTSAISSPQISGVFTISQLPWTAIIIQILVFSFVPSSSSSIFT